MYNFTLFVICRLPQQKIKNEKEPSQNFLVRKELMMTRKKEEKKQQCHYVKSSRQFSACDTDTCELQVLTHRPKVLPLQSARDHTIPVPSNLKSPWSA